VDALAVEPLRSGGEPDARYAAAQLRRLTELHLAAEEAVVRSRLQRLDPQADPDRYAATFSQLVALEQARRTVSEATV
jgi:DNA primase